MNWRSSLCAAALAAGVAYLAGGAALAQDYPQLRLRFGHFAPATTAHSQVDAWAAKEIERRSGGKITQQIFWAGAVGQASELLGLVGQGAVDIAAVPASYFPAQLPLLAAPSALPLALPDPQSAQRIMHTLWEEVPQLQEEARAQKVWPLFFHSLNQYHLLCRSPVKTLSDLKGLKIRSQGEYIPLALNAVGAVPVTVLPAEFYESLQRRSVDCMLLPLDLMTAFRLEEVAKFASSINFGALISNPQWYNLAKWEGFPPQVKKLLNDVAKDALKVDLDKAAESEQAAIEKMKAAGVQFVDFQEQKEFEAAMPDFLKIWTEKMEKAGKGEAANVMAKRWRELLQ